MNDPFTYLGKWWLPNSPDQVTEGTLEYDGNNHPELRLNGRITSIDPIEKPPLFIHGFSQKGKQITLYRCAITNSSNSYRARAQ